MAILKIHDSNGDPDSVVFETGDDINRSATDEDAVLSFYQEDDNGEQIPMEPWGYHFKRSEALLIYSLLGEALGLN